jgi:CBS domain containing-hemolysin-like protein
MVPRIQVFAVDMKQFNKKTMEKIISENYSRIPVYESNIDNILGVVYLKDLLIASMKNEQPDISTLIRKLIIVPDSKNIGKLLNEFQLRHQQMALVVNEYGGTEGIITMEDILEELVGEIQDEFDNEIPFVEKTSEKIYQVNASASIDDINEMLPHPLTKDKVYETLAGLLIFKFGKIPNVKERIQIDDYEFVVVKRSKSSVLLVQMHDLIE